MKCIFKLNPFSGFASDHTNFCSYLRRGQVCEETATHHANIGVSKEHPRGYCCRNVCKACAEYLQAKRRDVEITEGTYTVVELAVA